MKVLKSRIYEKMKTTVRPTLIQTQDKTDIAWGNQIRSYVLSRTPWSRIIGPITRVETSKAVMDGEIDEFVCLVAQSCPAEE